MPDFKYKAKNSAGKDVVGHMTANTKKDVLDRLAAQRLFPISVEDALRGVAEAVDGKI